MHTKKNHLNLRMYERTNDNVYESIAKLVVVNNMESTFSQVRLFVTFINN